MKPIICIFLLFMSLSSVHAELREDFPGLQGFFVQGPETVGSLSPIEWSVTITNSCSVTSRIDVATTVDAILYTGTSVFPVFRQVVTNQVPPFASETLSFSIGSGWLPTNSPPFDSVEIVASASLRDSSDFSANWIRAEYRESTNQVEVVE